MTPYSLVNMFLWYVLMVVVLRAEENFDYKFGGDDWGATCATGKKQSPIDIHFDQSSSRLGSYFKQSCEFTANIPRLGNHAVLNRLGQPQASFSVGQHENVHVVNTGAEVVWLFDDDFTKLEIPIRGHSLSGILHDQKVFLNNPFRTGRDVVQTVQAQFVNFHVHSPSEHMYNGYFAPLEGHIVMSIPQDKLSSCPEHGCLSVISVHFLHDELDTENDFIAATLKGLGEGFPNKTHVTLDVQGTLDFDLLLTDNPQYMLYEGSLTTPPCTEGVLWHVIKDPLVVSIDQVKQLQNAIGAVNDGNSRDNRNIQPLNGRELVFHDCI